MFVRIRSFGRIWETKIRLRTKEIFSFRLVTGCQMAIARFLDRMCLALRAWWTMAPLRCAAKFDPFLSLDCAPTPSSLAQSKERKGSDFAIWQPWLNNPENHLSLHKLMPLTGSGPANHSNEQLHGRRGWRGRPEAWGAQERLQHSLEILIEVQ